MPTAAVTAAPAIIRTTSPAVDPGQRHRSDSARASWCGCWSNPSRDLLSSYGFAASRFQRDLPDDAVHELRAALKALGPATGNLGDTVRCMQRALREGTAREFNAAMTVYRLQLIDINGSGANGITLFHTLICDGISVAPEHGAPGEEYLSPDMRVAIMIEHGADPDLATAGNSLPLEMAWTRGSADGRAIGIALMTMGCDPFKRDSDSRTMLHRAAIRGDHHLPRAWLAAGLPVNFITADQHYGTTPLLLAAKNGNLDTLLAVVQHCNPDLTSFNREVATDLRQAVAEYQRISERTVSRVLGNAEGLFSALGNRRLIDPTAAYEIHENNARIMQLLEHYINPAS